MAQARFALEEVRASRKAKPVSEEALPAKNYFTIGEASEYCGVKQHILRYWEDEFKQLCPVRRSGRRYYRRADVSTIREIRKLLYEQGYTISGARQILSGKNKQKNHAKTREKDVIKQIISELEELQKQLR